MDMPKPTEAHKKLEKLVGNWSGEEKISSFTVSLQPVLTA